MAECARCHRHPEKESPPVLCRCNEAETWEKADKHKDAYAVLLAPRARRMGELLNIPNVAAADACLNCHGVNNHAKDFKPGPSFKIQDGVSCVVCHGPYAEWVKEHWIAREKWRKLSREYKENHYGMRDLWNPAKRADLCASCHVGSAAEGKVVTHAMYAAGHPPLPGLEVATFSEQMPRHWQYPWEKSPEVQKLLQFSPSEARFEQSKLVLVGAVRALRDQMKLLAAQATAGAGAEGPHSAWPELAQFSCYACHHELRNPSWRQERGYTGRPGRPQARDWTLALVRLALQPTGGKEAQLRDALKPLHEAFDSRPFGKPDEVRTAAERAAGWSEELARKVGDIRLDRDKALDLLRDLCVIGGQGSPDYDSARQMAWAFRVIYRELASEHRPANHEKIESVLQALGRELRLELPSGREKSIIQQLPASLRAVSEYDPVQFRKRFKELQGLLPK